MCSDDLRAREELYEVPGGDQELIWRHQARPLVESRARNSVCCPKLGSRNYSYCSSHPARRCLFSALNSGCRGAAGL
eukprot:6024407-Pyramimonas_sp.AAC.1